MKTLRYIDLYYKNNVIKKQVDKIVGYLEADNFNMADVKKMQNTGFYRAKLDDTNRLLFKIGNYEDQKYIFLLEIIHNHEYEKSKFLNGVFIDESKFESVNQSENFQIDSTIQINYLNKNKKSFHFLDKIISFDETQNDIFDIESPLIIIGSAGSGKTAITLEKAKKLDGKILYITLSSYLVENSQLLYYSNQYENTSQEIDFFSYQDFLMSIKIPDRKELGFNDFKNWIFRYKQSHKIKDPYKVYEEFKGVLTGSVVDRPYLSKAEYLDLGIKKSIFNVSEKELIYDLFQKYIFFIKEQGFYDCNILSFEYQSFVESVYEYVIIDEVQDITNSQLYLILKSLKNPKNFLLCGDSNQIVHPNFFSWAQIKSLLYKEDWNSNISRVLSTNYRNTPEVTKIANQLLLIKNTRFGSIDRESNYLVKSNSKHIGKVEFFENITKINQDLNEKTKQSTNFAVIVMRDEDKESAKKVYQTPLLFSIHEAKGLEYENIIIFNILSTYDKEFRELTIGVTKEDLHKELEYSRVKDKTDKSLEENKFYVNSLYVAMTRAVKNLYFVETNKKHPLLSLLDLTEFKEKVSINQQQSTKEEWQKEANRLEKQGKLEQAADIRSSILKIQPVPWTVIDSKAVNELKNSALNPEFFNKKAKDKFIEYALLNQDTESLAKLSELKYKQADRWQTEKDNLFRKFYGEYKQDKPENLIPKLEKYGIDFRNEINLSPLMIATSNGSKNILKHLIENGANTNLRNNSGQNILQISICQSFIDFNYKKNIFSTVYNLLKKESLKLKIDNKQIKIDSHQAEYFMFNFMIGCNLQFLLLCASAKFQPFYETVDFLNYYENLSNQVLPEYRKKRSYISSILAKNEINKEDKYSKKLFLRVLNGRYIINPNIQIEVDEKWINCYELYNLDETINRYETLKRSFQYAKL
jgi:hypothetical protein